MTRFSPCRRHQLQTGTNSFLMVSLQLALSPQFASLVGAGVMLLLTVKVERFFYQLPNVSKTEKECGVGKRQDLPIGSSRGILWPPSTISHPSSFNRNHLTRVGIDKIKFVIETEWCWANHMCSRNVRYYCHSSHFHWSSFYGLH